MWKRIRNIFKANDEGQENPSVLIQRAIHEMHLSIQDSNVAIKNAKTSQYEIQKKLDQYRADAAQLQKEATELAKKKKEHEAKQVLVQKELVDKQVSQYEALNNNIWQTINQLQVQQQQMKLKIDELQTKEVLLSAKLTNAKTQADITQQLHELNQVTNFHFEQLEQDAQQMENMTTVLNSLQAGATEAEVDKILGQPSKVEQLNSSFENLLADIDKEERERQRQIEEAKSKKVDLLFSQMKGGKDSGLSGKNVVSGDTDNGKAKVNPDDFFTNTDNQIVKKTENVIDSFFTSADTKVETKVVREDSDNGNVVSEDTDNSKGGAGNSKENLLDSFFNNTQIPEKEEVKKDDKQKLLDDFFK
ncbi:MAG: PspA/IM30 family protein [Thermoflexibacter sp.]|jgi:phage shock protein A|nr:PspA/IM30 family protein [Thermoflexibacter sp.]